MSAGYYGRRFSDLYTTVNALGATVVVHARHITNPLTNQPLTVYNQDPATRLLVQNELTTIADLTQTYNGVEFQVNTRLSQGNLFGGLTIGRDFGDMDSGDLNNPNNRINNQGYVGFDRRTRSAAGSVTGHRTRHAILGIGA